MYVCICRQITDKQIREVCSQGSSRIADLRDKLGLASECGKCGRHALSIVNEFHNATPFVNALSV
ncbi:MAG: (2Fe-2S)-binding protein [Pseudomonadales bacterium]|nr:(2Fe-2S)-binding protein [Pseudomonadales bacterium]MCP5330944.1 (2Fe-2S)-binding protein [Pseudomonadales bacterium]MCP5344574.1 (2Fe-2S)-binding protein [Pseudomonadales bacterium]